MKDTVKFPAAEGVAAPVLEGGLGGTPQSSLHAKIGKSPLLEAPSCGAEDKTRKSQIQGHQDGLTLREIPSVEPWGMWEVGEASGRVIYMLALGHKSCECSLLLNEKLWLTLKHYTI